MNGHGQQATARVNCRGQVAPTRQAFTLVELLVVIVIIAILIALLVPTIGGALNSARNAQMGIEVSNLSQAMEAYRTEMNEYPPDFAGPVEIDNQKVAAHLARKFRYRNAKQPPPAGDALTVEALKGLDPAEALVFWLSGFSGDPKFPLNKREAIAVGTGLVKGTNPFFEFDLTRLMDKDNDGWPEYYPENSEAPYVYIRADNYVLSFDQSNLIKVLNGGVENNGRLVRAYATSGSTTDDVQWAAPEKYQIICAGQDGEYVPVEKESVAAGIIPTFPTGIGYTEADSDNITSFSEGKTLGDSIS